MSPNYKLQTQGQHQHPSSMAVAKGKGKTRSKKKILDSSIVTQNATQQEATNVQPHDESAPEVLASTHESVEERSDVFGSKHTEENTAKQEDRSEDIILDSKSSDTDGANKDLVQGKTPDEFPTVVANDSAERKEGEDSKSALDIEAQQKGIDEESKTLHPDDQKDPITKETEDVSPKEQDTPQPTEEATRQDNKDAESHPIDTTLVTQDALTSPPLSSDSKETIQGVDGEGQTRSHSKRQKGRRIKKTKPTTQQEATNVQPHDESAPEVLASTHESVEERSDVFGSKHTEENTAKQEDRSEDIILDSKSSDTDGANKDLVQGKTPDEFPTVVANDSAERKEGEDSKSALDIEAQQKGIDEESKTLHPDDQKDPITKETEDVSPKEQDTPQPTEEATRQDNKDAESHPIDTTLVTQDALTSPPLSSDSKETIQGVDGVTKIADSDKKAEGSGTPDIKQAGMPPKFAMKKNKIFFDFGVQEIFNGEGRVSINQGGNTSHRIIDSTNTISLSGSFGYTRILNRRYSVGFYVGTRGRGSSSAFYLSGTPQTKASLNTTFVSFVLGVNLLQRGNFFMATGVGVTLSFVYIEPYSSNSPILANGVALYGVGAGIAPRLMIGFRLGRNALTASITGTIAPQGLIAHGTSVPGFMVYAALVLGHEIKITDLVGISYSVGLGIAYMRSFGSFHFDGNNSASLDNYINYYVSANAGMSFAF